MLIAWLLCFLAIVVHSWGDNVIYGPDNPSDWGSWFQKITAQKEKDLASIGYDGSIYDVSGLEWTQSSFIQPQMQYDFVYISSTAITYQANVFTIQWI